MAKIQKEKRQKHAGTKNPIEVCPSVHLYLPLPPTKVTTNMKKAFYFLAVLLLLSCHHVSQKGHTVSVRIDPDEAENSIAADEWLDTAGCALIPLADTEKPITNATQLKTHRDKIYILDEETHCLHVFHADGTLDFSIDRRGKAGNEYLWLSDFHATGERLYLLDHIGQKILECDTLGRFIRKRDIDGYYANGIFATDEALFLVNEGSTPSRRNTIT